MSLSEGRDILDSGIFARRVGLISGGGEFVAVTDLYCFILIASSCNYGIFIDSDVPRTETAFVRRAVDYKMT
jgi:hypothetical protein